MIRLTHVVVKRTTAGMLSARLAPRTFSRLPPTSGILTSTLPVKRSCEPLAAGASQVLARHDPNPPETDDTGFARAGGRHRRASMSRRAPVSRRRE